MTAKIPEDYAKRGDVLFHANGVAKGEEFLTWATHRSLSDAFNAWQRIEPDSSGQVRDAVLKAAPDPHDLMVACDLFVRYGTEIAGALLFAGLPELYAAATGGPAVLASTDELVLLVGRRIAGTAQFLVDVFTPPATIAVTDGAHARGSELLHDALWGRRDDGTMGRAASAVAGLRVMHQTIRTREPAGSRGPTSPEAVINQRDLVATLLVFTIGTFEALGSFGMAWTADEQEAYYKVWCAIGIGIGIEEGLIPKSVPEARRKLAELRAELWQLPSKHRSFDQVVAGTLSGRKLARALVAYYDDCMPRWWRGLPLFVMRQVAPMHVRNRLALGASGALGAVIDWLPDRRLATDAFTVAYHPNRMGAVAMRSLTTAAAHRVLAALATAKDRPLVLPGLEEACAAARVEGRSFR